MNFRGDKVSWWSLLIVFVDFTSESYGKYFAVEFRLQCLTDMQTVIVLLDTQLPINKFMKKVINLIHKNNNR